MTIREEPPIAASPRRCVKEFGEAGYFANQYWSLHGPAGFFVTLSGSHSSGPGSVFVSQAEFDDVEWLHASISWKHRLPTYGDLKTLKRAVFGPTRFAYQVFASSGAHVNIHENALHLWGRADGKPALPDFTMGGKSI